MSPPARAALFALLATAVLGVAVVLGVDHPEGAAGAPAYLPTLTLLTVTGGGLVDGVNPCAFTVLLLLIAALLATTQVGGGAGAPATRGRVLLLGTIFVSAVFLTYLAVGVGLLSTGRFFTGSHWPSRLASLTAVVLGLWMLKDVFLPAAGLRLEAPHGLTSRAHGIARRATLPALVAGGFLIGLCTIPCSGAVYLAILALLAAQREPLTAYAYLLLYNLLFIAPLLAILAFASSRPVLVRLSRWQREYRERVRLVMGAGVTALGLMLLTVI